MGNGLIDIVFAKSRTNEVTFYLNTGERDHGGLPVFVRDISIPVEVRQNEGVCAVDLNGDGALDLMVHGQYIRNANPRGWPFQPAERMDLGVGRSPAFLDLTGDGTLDVIYLTGDGCEQRLLWRRNAGGDPPAFGPETPLEGLDIDTCTLVTAVTDGPERGILAQHHMYQHISFYAYAGYAEGRPC